MLKKIIASTAIAGGLALGLASPAQASEDGFLQGLSEDGIAITNASLALNTGYMVCAALDNGYSPVEVAGAVFHDVPSLTAHQSGYVVGLAIRELC